MKQIIGGYVGTTWDDFLVLPGAPKDDEPFTPEDVDLSINLAGIDLRIPFLAAAMRSVTGRDLALAAGKSGMMAVAPRGLSVEKEVEIVRHVKENAVGVNQIESEYRPTKVLNTCSLGEALDVSRKMGHSNIPVVTDKAELVGVFQYKPSRHDLMDMNTPIEREMVRYKNGNGDNQGLKVCRAGMSDDEIKAFMEENKLRFVPVIDGVGRVERLIFLQLKPGYRVGAAIDTHPGWEARAEELAAAGADMIFTDTSDAHKRFARDVISRYKNMFRNGPPICGGNVVTPDGFNYLVDAGADAIKIGMGPGSICTTNEVLGVGAPPFWSLVEVAKERDKLARAGKYVTVIADGGIEGTDNIAVALTYVDAIMGGRIFGCFLESEGDRVDRSGKIYPRERLQEENIVAIKIFGEGSAESRATTGDMGRYTAPTSTHGVATYQGVSGTVQYRGRFKPGVENYANTIREAFYHTGSRTPAEYRKNASLIRLSERARRTAAPHGIHVIG